MGNQSSVVFGFIVIAFFIFITLKGELPAYAGLLLLSPNTSGSNTNSTSTAVTSTIINGAIAAIG